MVYPVRADKVLQSQDEIPDQLNAQYENMVKNTKLLRVSPPSVISNAIDKGAASVKDAVSARFANFVGRKL